MLETVFALLFSPNAGPVWAFASAAITALVLLFNNKENTKTLNRKTNSDEFTAIIGGLKAQMEELRKDLAKAKEDARQAKEENEKCEERYQLIAEMCVELNNTVDQLKAKQGQLERELLDYRRNEAITTD